MRAQLDLNRRDPFSSDDGKAIPAQLNKVDLGKLRMAWSADLGCAPIASDIRQTFMDRLPAIASPFDDSFERDPFMGDVHETFEIMRGVNFVAAHRERLENHRDLLGPNVIDNTERGMAYSLADVAWAHTAQTKIHEKFHDFFADVDILICPGSSVSPFPHDQLTVTEINGEEMPTYMRWLAMTYALTKALPAACVIPCGVDAQGMPFGIQVVGPKGSDAKVLEIAHSLEAVLSGNAEAARPIPDLARLSS